MVAQGVEALKGYIRNVSDFPRQGIVFRDITTLLRDGQAFRKSIDLLQNRYSSEGVQKIAGIESRGFIFGAVLADRLGVGFVPIRKHGKLPAATFREEYQLEYGVDALEIHSDAISKGERVLIVDDLIATGGTAVATSRLIERVGGIVIGFAFLIELSFLHPREKLLGYDVFSLIAYDSE